MDLQQREAQRPTAANSGTYKQFLEEWSRRNDADYRQSLKENKRQISNRWCWLPLAIAVVIAICALLWLSADFRLWMEER